MREEIIHGEDKAIKNNGIYIKLKSLTSRYVSVMRESISEHSSDGFPISLSTQLVQLLNVWDFHIDGYKIFPILDISEVTCEETEQFFHKIMEQEGGINPVSILTPSTLENWQALFNFFYDNKQIIVVEDEHNGTFLIGKVIKIEEERMLMSPVDALGVWDEESKPIEYCSITSVSYGDKYSEMLIKYAINHNEEYLDTK